MVIWPTQSLETYWCSPWDVNGSRPPADCCVDDMPTVGAMYALLEKMRRLPQRFASPAEQKQWAEFQAILPPLPTNATHLLPAAVYPKQGHNSETPELYAVHPWRLFSVGRKLTSGTNLSKAITSFNTDPQAFSPNANAGWCQGVMQAALLGLPTQAWSLVMGRAETGPSEGLRFPGFAPPVQDSEPSADHFANMMQALQWMLLQPGDDAAASVRLVRLLDAHAGRLANNCTAIRSLSSLRGPVHEPSSSSSQLPATRRSSWITMAKAHSGCWMSSLPPATHPSSSQIALPARTLRWRSLNTPSRNPTTTLLRLSRTCAAAAARPTLHLGRRSFVSSKHGLKRPIHRHRRRRRRARRLSLPRHRRTDGSP